MGCQQSKIRALAPSSAKRPSEVMADNATTPVTFKIDSDVAASGEEVRCDASALRRRSGTRVTFITRECSPEAVRPPMEDVPVDVASPPRPASRSKSSSLEGIEPDVFHISKACSFEKMYRRWNRKQRMIAERNTVSVAENFTKLISHIDHSDVSNLDIDNDNIVAPVTTELLYAASPERAQASPLHASMLAFPLFKEDVVSTHASPAKTHASPLCARSSNNQQPLGINTPLALSGTYSNSCGGASPLRCKLQPSFVSPMCPGDENAPLADCAVTPVKMAAVISGTPSSGRKGRGASKSGKQKVHQNNQDHSATTDGPVAPRWDKGSRALMQTQLYLEMAAAFKGLMSSGSFHL